MVAWSADGNNKAAVISALLSEVPEISPSFLYDDIGCQLYEQIVELEEYYLPAAEREILDLHMNEIARSDFNSEQRQVVVIELGAGDGHRTVELVHAISKEAMESVYVPTDISSVAMDANQTKFMAHPGLPSNLRCAPLVGTHDEVLATASTKFVGTKTILFLGSSLGNYNDDESVELMRLIGSHMRQEDRFLIGVDLEHSGTKPIQKIIAAVSTREPDCNHAQHLLGT